VGQLPTIGDLSHLPGSCCRFVGDVFDSVDDESDFSEKARTIQPFRPSAVLFAGMNTIVFDLASVSHLSRGKSLEFFAWLVVHRN
jgi:hypothetical protein